MAQSLLRHDWFREPANVNVKLESVDLVMFCRACLIETEEMNSYAIDSTDDVMMGDESLRQILEKVIGFDLDGVDELETMPNRICQKCYDSLTQFYAFRNECLQSNIALQNYLNRSATVPSENSTEASLFIISKIKEETDPIDAPAIANVSEDNYGGCTGTDDDSNFENRLHNGFADDPLNEECETRLEILCFFGISKDEEPMLKCINCELVLHSVRAMYSHISVHQPVPRDRKCPHCHREFPGSAPLRRHLAVHSDLRAFKCSLCHKTYKRLDDLQYHFKIHQKD